jgi:hypothetical protein
MANSCISGSRNFIIFLYFIHLRRKFNSLQRYDIAQNYRILHRVVQRLSQHNLKNFAPSPYLKTASNKRMIQIKLIGMSMISYYTKVHLSKCNSSWVVSTKQNTNFNIQTPCSYFLFLTKMVLLKVVHPLKIYQYTKFHGPMLTGASFLSTSEV